MSYYSAGRRANNVGGDRNYRSGRTDNTPGGNKEVTYTERMQGGGGSLLVIVGGGYYCNAFLKSDLNMLYMPQNNKEWRSRAPMTPHEVAQAINRLSAHCGNNAIKLRRVGNPPVVFGMSSSSQATPMADANLSQTSNNAVVVLETAVDGDVVVAVRNSFAIKEDLKSLGFWWAGGVGTNPHKEWRSQKHLHADDRRALVAPIKEACSRVMPVPMECIVQGSLSSAAPVVAAPSPATTVPPSAPAGLRAGAGMSGHLDHGSVQPDPDPIGPAADGLGNGGASSRTSPAFLAAASAGSQYYPGSPALNPATAPARLSQGPVGGGANGASSRIGSTGGISSEKQGAESGTSYRTLSEQVQGLLKNPQQANVGGRVVPKPEPVEASSSVNGMFPGSTVGNAEMPSPSSMPVRTPVKMEMITETAPARAATGSAAAMPSNSTPPTPIGPSAALAPTLAVRVGSDGEGDGQRVILVVKYCFDVRKALREELKLIWAPEDQEFLSKPVAVDEAKMVAEAIQRLCRSADVPVPALPEFPFSPSPPAERALAGSECLQQREPEPRRLSFNQEQQHEQSLSSQELPSPFSQGSAFSQESAIIGGPTLSQQTISQQSFGEEECSPPDTPPDTTDADNRYRDRRREHDDHHNAHDPRSKHPSTSNAVTPDERSLQASSLSSPHRYITYPWEAAASEIAKTGGNKRGRAERELFASPNDNSTQDNDGANKRTRVMHGAENNSSLAARDVTPDRQQRDAGYYRLARRRAGSIDVPLLVCREPDSWVSMAFSREFTRPRFSLRSSCVSNGGEEQERLLEVDGDDRCSTVAAPGFRERERGKGQSSEDDKRDADARRWPSTFPSLEVTVGGEGSQARRAMQCLLAESGMVGGRKQGGPLEGVLVWRPDTKVCLRSSSSFASFCLAARSLLDVFLFVYASCVCVWR